MANRAYLYSLSNRPTSYADRPETISGLSEWPYDIPFSYRVLMSGDPRLCSSLVSDGFASDPPSRKTRLYAISSDFALGFARLEKLLSSLRAMGAGGAPDLVAAVDESLAFLEAHRDRYLLLETIELDSMSEEEEGPLRACVEREIETCRRVGLAVDALPDDVADASARLRAATQEKAPVPFDLFFGLLLDDDFDSVRSKKTRHTEHPLGLSFWSDVLYFQLWNRAELEANRGRA